MRREKKKPDCLCPLSGRAGAEWEELMRCRFMLLSGFSCHEHQEGAEQDMEVPVDKVCPALCWPCSSSWWKMCSSWGSADYQILSMTDSS